MRLIRTAAMAFLLGALALQACADIRCPGAIREKIREARAGHLVRPGARCLYGQDPARPRRRQREYDPKATAAALDGVKTVIIAVGVSNKGFGQAGITADPRWRAPRPSSTPPRARISASCLSISAVRSGARAFGPVHRTGRAGGRPVGRDQGRQRRRLFRESVEVGQHSAAADRSVSGSRQGPGQSDGVELTSPADLVVIDASGHPCAAAARSGHACPLHRSARGGEQRLSVSGDCRLLHRDGLIAFRSEFTSPARGANPRSPALSPPVCGLAAIASSRRPPVPAE